MMRTTLLWLTLASSALLPAQVATPPPASGAAGTSMSADLDRLQAAARQANADILSIRVEKWKTDAETKHESEANAASIERNLTTALPGLISDFQAAPQNLNAGFKLYRNLNALYDVMVSFTESAGAFGPKDEYDALAQHLNVIDSVRHDLANDLESLTALTQNELNSLRMQVRSLQESATATAAANPPKKVVVDNSAPAKKTTSHKKKTASSSSQKPGAGTTTATPATTKPPQ